MWFIPSYLVHGSEGGIFLPTSTLLLTKTYIYDFVPFLKYIYSALYWPFFLFYLFKVEKRKTHSRKIFLSAAASRLSQTWHQTEQSEILALISRLIIQTWYFNLDMEVVFNVRCSDSSPSTLLSEPEFVNLLRSPDSIPSLAGRYDNPI